MLLYKSERISRPITNVNLAGVTLDVTAASLTNNMLQILYCDVKSFADKTNI